jgi:hypothetical protein
MARLIHLVTYAGDILLLFMVLLSGTIRIQDWIFRQSAERLFDEIQSIEIGHTSFQKTRSILNRWGNSGVLVEPCTQQQCEIDITISKPTIWRNSSKFIPKMLPYYRFLGGHPAIVRADVHVWIGFVQAKHYSLAIEAPPFVSVDGRHLSQYVEGKISTEPEDDASHPVRQALDKHSEYQIGSNACLGCLEIHVTFTPAASSADVQRLSQINFSCLTRQHPCRTRGDLMPNAVSENSLEMQPSVAPL